MSNTRLNNLAILNIEHKARQNINFEDAISAFATVKPNEIYFKGNLFSIFLFSIKIVLYA